MRRRENQRNFSSSPHLPIKMRRSKKFLAFFPTPHFDWLHPKRINFYFPHFYQSNENEEKGESKGIFLFSPFTFKYGEKRNNFLFLSDLKHEIPIYDKRVQSERYLERNYIDFCTLVNNNILSEGALSETTLKNEIPISGKRGLVKRRNGTLKETTLILAHHRNDIILSEGALSETTLKYEIHVCCKRV